MIPECAPVLYYVNGLSLATFPPLPHASAHSREYGFVFDEIAMAAFRGSAANRSRRENNSSLALGQWLIMITLEYLYILRPFRHLLLSESYKIP